MENQNKKNPPDPSKFEIYEETEDKSGFTTPDGNFYKYDVYGGWYDEFQNYYNCDCEPCDPPPDEDHKIYDDDNDHQDYQNDDEIEDDQQMTDIELKLKRETRIEVLNEILDNYDENSEVQIFYSNMFTWAVENDIKNWDKNGKITGQGDFTVENVQTARLIIEKKTHTFFQFENKPLQKLIYLNLQDDLDNEDYDVQQYQNQNYQDEIQNKKDKIQHQQDQRPAENTKINEQQDEEQKQEIFQKLSIQEIDQIFSEEGDYQITIPLTQNHNKKYYEDLLKKNFNDNDFYSKKIILQNINDHLCITKSSKQTTNNDIKKVFIFLNKENIQAKVEKQK